MKPFTIYKVETDEDSRHVEMATAVVTRVTKLYWFFERGGLAFDCRTRCSIGQYATSEYAAWEEFCKRVAENLRLYEKRKHNLLSQLHQAQRATQQLVRKYPR